MRAHQFISVGCFLGRGWGAWFRKTMENKQQVIVETLKTREKRYFVKFPLLSLSLSKNYTIAMKKQVYVSQD